MAAWRATGGSEDGFAAFDSWSSKSSKYNADTTRKRWEGFSTSPPTIIGAGTIFWLADRAAPGWRPQKVAGDAERIAARVKELALLDPVAYALARKAAGKELGIDLKTLDGEVARYRAGPAEEVPLYEHWKVEPWSEPVDTDDLLLAIQDEITRYVTTLGARVVVPALWVMFTWVHEHARHSPMLLVNSAEPDSGKTTLLSVMSYLVWKPLTSVEISGPMLYRSIEKWHPTFLIDEADVVLEHNDDLRAVINSGWTRGQGVVRGAPETHEPQMFSTFAPKALGMKGRALPDTTLSRCIEVTLKRKLPDEKVVDFKYEDDDYLAELRSKLMRWAADYGEQLGRAKPKRIPGFANRLWMNWRPLVAIAELASDVALADCVKAAQIIESAKRGDVLSSSLTIQLLEDIRAVFDDEAEDELLSRVIVEALVADAEKPWAQLTKGRPLTQNKLAKMLSPFGIISEEVHPEYGDERRKHGKGYRRERFEEAWERYLARAAEKPGSKAR
jgi:putative DNA primase/helicase